MGRKALKIDFLKDKTFVDHKAVSSSETCRIYKLPNPRKTIEGFNATQITANLLKAAFPATSENSCCEKANRALGFSENTIRSILRVETVRVDARILLQAAAYCMSVGIDPMKVAGLKELYSKSCGGQ